MAVDPKTGRPVCSVCGDSIDPNANGVWAKVEGWAQNRAAGGTHALAERTPLREWIHPTCFALLKYDRPGQEGLPL